MIHFGTKQQYILHIRWKQEWWILERTKRLRTIIFENWNKTRTNSFVKMGKSTSNVPNVFKTLSLTGHRVRAYLELHKVIYCFFNISLFTAHIQRFWTEITNSAVFAEIFIPQKWVFLPGLRSQERLESRHNDSPPLSLINWRHSSEGPSGICLPGTELLQSPFRTEFSMGSRSRRSLRRHRRLLRSYRRFLRSYRRSLRHPIVARLAKHTTLLNIVKYHKTHVKHCDTS